ncbi:MAG: ribosomal RNA small subunit methyltransferase A [Firmicutes bacterium]|nr:ribosomal RNA small subunit methyltransferase A [Bacillota bacterium]
MEKDFQFKKKFGQNFLKDDSIPKKIVSYSDISEDTLVIEIGPGAGALTKELVKRAKMVLAYEIDTSLEDVLREKFGDTSNVDFIFDDFLNRDVSKDIEKYSYKNLYVVANLPYYITTPIIVKLIEENILIDKIVVMVQKEVGDRFSALPGNREYGSLTVFLNYFFDVKKLFLVGKNCFIPKPNVDSIVVSFNRKNELLDLKDKEKFFKLVRDSFQYKRKTLRNNLKNYDLDKVSLTLKKYNLDLQVRAEELPLEVFVDISNNL